jgi:hypothetical protein
MLFLKLVVLDTYYTSWKLVSLDDGTVPDSIPFEFSPIGFFTGDVVSWDGVAVHLVESPVRMREFCGVLMLAGGKTYGRSGSGRRSRLLYSCMPFAPDLPPFLIPFDVDIGFVKTVESRYISFRFDSWKPNQKHPQGICLQNFGAVSSLSAYSNYLLWAHELLPRPKMIQNLPAFDDNGGCRVVPSVVPSVVPCEFIFSMDPLHTQCFDDAIGISYEAGIWTIRIYIADCSSLCCCGAANFWVSNIYLLGHRYSMFPSDWVQQLSLKAGSARSAVQLRIRFRRVDAVLQLLDTEFSLVDSLVVNVNGVYGVPFQHPLFEPFLLLTEEWFGSMEGAGFDSLGVDVVDKRHRQMICHWMLFWNQTADLWMQSSGVSAFYKHRASKLNCGGGGDVWNMLQGEYDGGDRGPYFYGVCHLDTVVGVSAFLQSTSPLRRRIDFMNQMILVSMIRGVPLESTLIASWIVDLPRWNMQTLAISKITSQIRLLQFMESFEDGVSHEITGIVVDSFEDSRYNVFLPSLHVFSTLRHLEPIDPGTSLLFRLFYFAHEFHVKKKVRLGVC